MQEFFAIFSQIILPVFVLIGLGVVLQRKFKLDLDTLAKINMYLFVPAVIFVKLYETEFAANIFFQILFFFILLILSLKLLSALISKLFKHSKSMRTAFSNSVLFYNSGNYGIPVNDLVFRGDAFAMSIQIIVLTFQNILTFSYGVVALQSVGGFQWKTIFNYFRTPLFIMIALGASLNYFNVSVPQFIMVPAGYLSDGMVAVALFTLGAQVAFLKINSFNATIAASLMTRLLLGPALAFAIILAFGLEGILAQALLISSAMPTSVNSSIIAQVYKNEPEYAAQVVWMSTLLSSITVCLVIYFANWYF